MTSDSSFFSVRSSDGVQVIEFAQSEITDAAYIKVLGDRIYHHIKTIDHPQLVVDFGKVRFLSSSALGMLIALKKVVAKHEGELRLSSLNDDLTKLFKLTKFNKVFKICDTAEKAVQSFA
ncbi:MAG: STAS domain-containing protein [Planctomycetota bacterium]